MSKHWATVKLGEVLHRSQETIEPQADEEYREITVRLWGNGVVERGRIRGASLSGRRFVARTGQFIASRIDARNGAMGLVPESLDGALVTNDFPLFNLDPEHLDPSFLGWLCRTAGFVELCLRASEGTTNRVRLKEDRFLALEIPLPPLTEQRRVVSRIDELAAQIQCAQMFRAQAAVEADVLLQNAIGPIIGGSWPVLSLEQACDSERPITYGIVQAGDHIPDGVPYIRVSDMAKPQLTPVGMLRTSPEIAKRYRRSAVQEGDIVFAIRATVGKMRFVPKELDGANLTQGTARIAASRHALPRFLYWALQSRTVVDTIQSATKGSTFKEITLGRLRSVSIPLPPLPEQLRIVSELNALQTEVDALRRLQAETATEIDALLPSVLSKAFDGEL